MDLNGIYSQLIMEHNKSGHNKKEIDNPDYTERGHNPSCGDDLTVSVKFNKDILEDISFMGTGCAISEASASMMIDLIKGKTKEEAIDDIETFMGMIKKEITDEEELEKLEDAIVLKNISNMPARVKCGVLAWHTLNEILKK
ncbi:Fe-S cluster assembly sulfur transfer protein SufU [Dethiothermospora halolimnae]|uniref:Fe-S cluster assembly sulfur transfer protein SufU n=1 Tax=Dethiothermospora halolimnae TaxID=3114390 RepID=UPI003CCB825E